MSRPKGSKNKPKNTDTIDPRTEQEPSQVIKRGRGRPKGSFKKKDILPEVETKKDNPILFGNIKDLKRQIRELRKIKLQCRAGSSERIELHRKMIALKKQLKEVKEIKPQNITPLEFKRKERPQEPQFIEEKHSDNNGCSYFSYCKKINREGLVNHTCYNPLYIITKLENKCSQLRRK
jgi:hypothetical protein